MKEKVCGKNCPDFKGMEILHREQCDCSCHLPTEGVGDWEEEFNRLAKAHGWKDCVPSLRILKSFIRSLLSSQAEEMRHDHEILVNTILDTKIKETEEMERKLNNINLTEYKEMDGINAVDRLKDDIINIIKAE